MFRKLDKKYTPKMIAEAMMQGFEDPDMCQRCGEAQRGVGTSFCERCSQTSGAAAGDAEFYDDDKMPHERVLGEEGDEPEPSPEELEAIEAGDPYAGEDPRSVSPKERRIRGLEDKYREHAAQEGEMGYQGW